VPHQHQPAAVPVIMDETDEDILLDAQRHCYVKEEETTASAAVTSGDAAKPMTGKGKRKMELSSLRRNSQSSSAKRSRNS
jgi:hypothetical protein